MLYRTSARPSSLVVMILNFCSRQILVVAIAILQITSNWKDCWCTGTWLHTEMWSGSLEGKGCKSALKLWCAAWTRLLKTFLLLKLRSCVHWENKLGQLVENITLQDKIGKKTASSSFSSQFGLTYGISFYHHHLNIKMNSIVLFCLYVEVCLLIRLNISSFWKPHIILPCIFSTGVL